jgi:predicted RNA-binding Zn ribbon-like protein
MVTAAVRLIEAAAGAVRNGSLAAVVSNGQERAWHITYACGKRRQGAEGFEEFMALIEIPDVCNSDSAASAAGRGRFAIIGEPVVAVDLINTVAAPGSAVADDLLSADRGAEAWWRTQKARVPAGDVPDIRALCRLRSALRDLIEALVDARPVTQASVADLNFFMQSAPASTRLQLTAGGLRVQTQWHWEYGGNPRLAFIATQAAEFLSDTAQVRRLRRCASPACTRSGRRAINPELVPRADALVPPPSVASGSVVHRS